MKALAFYTVAIATMIANLVLAIICLIDPNVFVRYLSLANLAAVGFLGAVTLACHKYKAF